MRHANKWDYPAYVAFRIFVWLMNVLPLDVALSIGSLAGSIVFKMGIKKRFVINNIKRVLGKGHEEARSIADSFYKNLAMNLVEFARLKKITRYYMERNVAFSGHEIIDRELSKNKGVVILTAHFGNWELLGAALAHKGYRLNVVVRPLDNVYLNAYTAEVRTMFGGALIEKKNALGKMLRLLRGGSMVAILLDQRAGRREGVEVDFLGIPALTSKGLAAVAMKTNCAVTPVFIRRVEREKHRIEVLNPIDIVSTGRKEDDLKENTRRFNCALESFIKLYPDQWFWFHSRWERGKRR